MLRSPSHREGSRFVLLRKGHHMNHAPLTHCSRRTLARIGAGSAVAAGMFPASLNSIAAQVGTPTATTLPDTVTAMVEGYMTDLDLRAVLVHVQQGDEVLASLAFGESMTGVPATTDMHFRNGAVAISLVATLVLVLVDEGVFGLDDTIDAWLPDLPEANAATIRMLLNMTAGYRDYVQSTDFATAEQVDPFRDFTADQLLGYSFAQPRLFAPGENWEYAHTQYVLLGLVMEAATGSTVDVLMQEKVLDLLGLDQTQNFFTPEIPEPVLHAFTSERRAILQIPEDMRFYEESTFWNPSWSITRGAIQTTTIADMAASMAGVARGDLLTPESYAEQFSRELVGFGSPLDGCNSCHTMTENQVYGLGVWMAGPWVFQNPLFAGYSGTAGYMADGDLSIAVAVTYSEGSFGVDGDYLHGNVSTTIFKAIGDLFTGPLATPVAG
jgi:CubicO group peptidase (beta-lactamase class C family)